MVTNKRIILFLLAMTAVMSALAQVFDTSSSEQHPPKYEVRAVWLTTIGGIDWPRTKATSPQMAELQRQELCRVLDRLQQGGINTVLLQTRVRATTIYPSRLEPWDACLTGTASRSPGYDPLQFAIDECHRRGMELHAWLVTMPIGKWNGAGCRAVRQIHPTIVKKIGQDGFLNPEKPQTADYVADVCEEITRRYDVDGIHLDYIRYPDEWRITVPRQQGRENITRIVRTVYSRVKNIKPWVKLSSSPVGKYKDLTRYSSRGWNAFDKVCQDAQGWLREGIMDALFPMMYFRGDQFYPFAVDWAENTYGRIVVPGLGVYFLDEARWPLTDITRELHFLRQLGLGHCYYRSQFYTNNTKGLYTYVTREIDRYPALVPPMTWQSQTPPRQPENLTVSPQSDGSVSLSWTHAGNPSDISFNIYASTEYPVDITDARNLIATRRQQPSLVIPTRNSAGLYYAVTATDRYGLESQPLNFPSQRSPLSGWGEEWLAESSAAPLLLVGSGETLQLPSRIGTVDCDYIIVETLQGTIIHSQRMPRSGSRSFGEQRGVVIDISRVPEGFYCLRSIGKKNRQHRLGFFMVKR